MRTYKHTLHAKKVEYRLGAGREGSLEEVAGRGGGTTPSEEEEEEEEVGGGGGA